ncbi:hypothetical protein BSLA_01r0900 [Burkholderia stabilis]|nr:hypothetical protein BSLA_01r0900 [Burkholderia stabilis]
MLFWAARRGVGRRVGTGSEWLYFFARRRECFFSSCSDGPAVRKAAQLFTGI